MNYVFAGLRVKRTNAVSTVAITLTRTVYVARNKKRMENVEVEWRRSDYVRLLVKRINIDDFYRRANVILCGEAVLKLGWRPSDYCAAVR